MLQEAAAEDTLPGQEVGQEVGQEAGGVRRDGHEPLLLVRGCCLNVSTTWAADMTAGTPANQGE